jgi:hypothetical protein
VAALPFSPIASGSKSLDPRALNECDLIPTTFGWPWTRIIFTVALVVAITRPVVDTARTCARLGNGFHVVGNATYTLSG